MHSKETELAWAAGFFDGEGSAFFGQGNRGKNSAGRLTYTTLKLDVTQTELAPLERFRTAVGGIGSIYGPYRNKTSKKDYWRFMVYGYEKYKSVMEQLWPYLGQTKRNQLERHLKAWEARPRQKVGRKPQLNA